MAQLRLADVRPRLPFFFLFSIIVGGSGGWWTVCVCQTKSLSFLAMLTVLVHGPPPECKPDHYCDKHFWIQWFQKCFQSRGLVGWWGGPEKRRRVGWERAVITMFEIKTETEWVCKLCSSFECSLKSYVNDVFHYVSSSRQNLMLPHFVLFKLPVPPLLCHLSPGCAISEFTNKSLWIPMSEMFVKCNLKFQFDSRPSWREVCTKFSYADLLTKPVILMSSEYRQRESFRWCRGGEVFEERTVNVKSTNVNQFCNLKVVKFRSCLASQ